MNEIIEGDYEEIQDMPQEMSDDELVHICMDEISNSLADQDGDENITVPLDYYYGRRPRLEYCKDPKASGVVSMDVHDAIEATVAEVMPAFGGGKIATFEAESMAEEEQVKAEEDICNYLLMERYNGSEILTTALKDCLLHRNAYAKVCWDTRREVGYETYEGVTEQDLAQIMQPRVEGEEIEVTAHQEVDPPMEVQQQFQQYMQQYEAQMMQLQQEQMMGMVPQQVPQQPQMPQYFEVSLKRITVKSNPVIESVAPEHALIDSTLQEVDLDGAKFTAHRSLPTRSELIAQGYDRSIVEELPPYATSGDAYSRRSQSTQYPTHAGSHDATDTIEVYECYVRVDKDRDGIAEMRRVIISNNRLLHEEPWDQTDMVAGATCIMPHQHQGVSMFDIMRGIQDSKTDITRSIIDGARLAANPRVEADHNAVNFDDLLTSTRGGVVRSKRIGSVVALPNPEIPPSVFATLEMMDKLRRERGGSAVDSSAQTMTIGGDSAHGIERVMSNIELTNAQLAKTFGETFVRGLFLRLHSLIRKYHRGEISAKIDGQWVSSDPQHWPQRDRVSINVGNSQGERLRMAGAMQGIQAIQKEMLAQGMITTTAEQLYESSVDMAEYLGVAHAEKYFLDPNSEEGQQAAQQMQQQQQQMQQKAEVQERFQMQLAMQQAESQATIAQAEMGKVQAQMQNNQLKHEIERLNQQIDALKAGVDSRLEEEKMNRDTALKLLEIEEKAQSQKDAEYLQNKSVA
jgi:hypothetical protein